MTSRPSGPVLPFANNAWHDATNAVKPTSPVMITL